MSRKVEKLLAVRRDQGLGAVAKAVGRSLISSLCDYQIQEVRGRTIADQDAAWVPPEGETPCAIECSIVESGSSLEPFTAEFSLPFRDSFAALERRLDQGCTLILARRIEKDSNEIAGYSILERGGFSAAGVKGKVSNRIVFIHHTEVAHKYRGQRIAQVLTTVMKEYCRSHGIKASLTAHTTGNVPSERAFGRVSSSRLLCHAVRVSFLRGLFVWHTPRRKIERAIGTVDDNPMFEVRGSKFEVSEQVEVEPKDQKKVEA